MAVEEKEAAGAGAPASTTAPDIRLEQVTKRFDDVVAVDELSLEVPRGSFFALLGPSGCGKTTTLRMIGGFEEPTEGTIYLADRDVTGQPPYKRDVNTVFQSYALFPHLSIFDNVAFGLRRRGVKGGDLLGRVARMLELVQLRGFERRKPQQLSGGQQQRVALARALVNSPQVLLLDEPLGALDLKLRKEMQLFIKGLQHDLGITFIHVTHDQEEAMTMADSIAVMNEGHIEQLGAPTDLYEHPRTAFVARFLGVSNMLEGTADGDGVVRLKDGTVVRAPTASGRKGRVAIGIRPEKIRLGEFFPHHPPPNGVTTSEGNSLAGEIAERSYIGVSTQYIVKTKAGTITVYVQNADPGAGAYEPGDQVALSWSPEVTFVVEHEEEETE
jgi:spermidine/putrescine transport system ATP-binding protein